MDVRPLTLSGELVRLEPLTLEHAEDLLAAADDPAIWLYMPRAEPHAVSEMQSVIADALLAAKGGLELPFAIVERKSGRAIGSTRYLDIRPAHRGLEIGWTWIASRVQRTGVNTECKRLLFAHAFDELGALRVQLKTDARNLRSQAAIERVGGVREGVLRRHMTLWNGFVRDTVMYSIVREEWPVVRARLDHLLRVSCVLLAFALSRSLAFAGKVPAPGGPPTIAQVPDRDGDGLPDLACGFAHDPAGGRERGSVRVISSASGRVLDTLRGASDGEQFGACVCALGDFDGDGVDDFAASALVGFDPSRLSNTSSFVRILSGKDGHELGVLKGERPNDGLGWSIASMGDIDGDGVREIVVGAPGKAMAFVFSGRGGARLFAVQSEILNGNFGFSVCDAGDFDGDGRGDFAVGAPGEDRDGRVLVLSGRRGALLCCIDPPLARAELGIRFGAALALLGDIDGDGRLDFAVGCDGFRAGGGTVFVISADPARGVLHELRGTCMAWDRFGTALANAGDLDGDGVDDLAVGDPADAPERGLLAHSECGSVRIFSGRSGQLLARVFGADPEQRLGRSLAGVAPRGGRRALWAEAGGPDYGALEAVSIAGQPPRIERAFQLDISSLPSKR